ncbi:hypothetical protein JYP52_04010 [Nitratireductor aquibiodomus]|uniref:hypothetical protein n=1 Tax=Nitratireductor aquibiodomus TaxID=204799 RepID=UPI0019D3643B|nr:hypothetical protein [Nitratireductor aquibiodomus]MBN7760288.1 hypothetical protein [Nitratireductor aquibiodomus]
MEYHVKNESHVAKAFKVRGGHTVVPAGKKADLVGAKELTEEQIEAFEREGVKVKAKGAKASKVEAGLVAKHHGGGKFNIVDGDDVLLSGLTKADADAFNAMSDEDKSDYLQSSTVD